MIVSWNWLTQYVRLEMPVEVLTERLALTGLNHESTAEVGGDLAIDLEVTSNRPDCSGPSGRRAEISVLFDVPLRVPDPHPATSGAAVETLAAVSVEATDVCSRFTARVITGATIKESPWWLRKRLETTGRAADQQRRRRDELRPVRDRPTAPRLRSRSSQRPPVNRATRPAGRKNDRHQRQNLRPRPEMVVIADAERPVGLAGVMGGLDTEIGRSDSEYLDRGRAVRRHIRAENRTRAGLVQPVQLSLRAADRPRGDGMGEPSLCRTDSRNGRRHASSRPD